MHKFPKSEKLTEFCLLNLGKQVSILRSAMEKNAFSKVRKLSSKIKSISRALNIEELTIACKNMDNVCRERCLSQLLPSYEIIEVITLKYVDLVKIRSTHFRLDF